MPGDTIAKTDKVRIIETIRGLAALAVCLFHFSKCNIDFLGSTQYFFKVAGFGWLGVEAFFVVSGFIIPYSLDKANYNLTQFFRFFARRCIRIEPAYLVSILLVIVLAYIVEMIPGFMGKQSGLNAENILLHIGYLPEHFGYTWLLPVYWSLEAEFHYYILIGLTFTFIWKKKVNLLFGIALGFVASFFIPLYVFGFMPYFIMGIITCAKRAGKADVYSFYAVLIAAFFICIIRKQGWMMPVVGLSTAVLITYCKLALPATDFLGKISFSLYLVHVPVGGKIINLLGRYTYNEWQVWGVLIIALVATIFTSYIFYKFIEYPSQKLSRRISYKYIEKSTDHISTLPTS